ncbi:MAG: hypothetical protein EBR15_07110 [Gammaproteobacteria bacterium]|jgi:hypothetical protein|nr:hypothetical protein [Gammaproteobacteria bacterium]
MGYVLFALLLLGIIAAVVGRMNSEQQNAEWIDRAQSTLRGNLQVIRSQILLCAVAANTEDAGLLAALPVSANGETGITLDSVTCAGSSTKLFDGTNTVFLPRPPPGFTEWRYVNLFTDDSKRPIYVYTSTTSPQATTAARRLARNFGTEEVELKTATDGKTTLTFYIRKSAA